MRKIYVFLLAVVGLGAFGGCNIINPSEVVPTYFQVDSFDFTRGLQLGSTSRKITNIWVYFNNLPVGNFDLPARFPVIADATGQLTIFPGIDAGGMRSSPVINPLYLGDTMTFNPAPGTIIPYTPRTGYNILAKLYFEETFNGTNSFTKYGGDTSIDRTSDISKVFEGAGSGRIWLPPGKDSSLIVGGAIPMLPRGVDAYLELDYKSTATLRIGMLSFLKNGSIEYVEQIIGLNPRNSWRHIYINIKNFIAAFEGTYYKVFIRADKPTGQAEAEVLIDNVKVISY